nr:MAG TPA: hypothetical protein [Caudoviricetes sp.]
MSLSLCYILPHYGVYSNPLNQQKNRLYIRRKIV